MTAIDEKNSAFWDELCGTGLARALGATDKTAASLAKFDYWYFAFYWYLSRHIPYEQLRGKKVLEIGLGYGSVAERLMKSGAIYTGLDIAKGPVEMVRHRADLSGISAEAQQGNALQLPFADATFDYVVSIGCLHHTGDLARALDEVARVLKPGGGVSLMVYNALSYRQWLDDPSGTLKRARSPKFSWSNANESARRAYDANHEGAAAPSTTFVSPEEAKSYLSRYFANVTTRTRNVNCLFPPTWIWPRWLITSCVDPWFGLDLYINATSANPAGSIARHR